MKRTFDVFFVSMFVWFVQLFFACVSATVPGHYSLNWDTPEKCWHTCQKMVTYVCNEE